MSWKVLPGVCLTLVVGLAISMSAASKPVVLPDPQLDDPLTATSSKASMVIAGGCFWGIEEVYQHVRGVVDAVSGYSGGTAKTADYDLVSTGTTGHAESVRVTYDPSKISYGQLLKIFLSVGHDPTQVGGQGPDHGPQYRSAIFFSDERQRQIARAYLDQLTAVRVFEHKITTQVVPLQAFYEAEADHQDYARHNPTQPYIVINDLPKVENLKKMFAAVYR
jgi:peptide-methionine (S)-S-oxide reductase